MNVLQAAGLQRAGTEKRTVGVRDLEKALLLLAGLCLIAPAGARAADAVTLKDGLVVEGEIVRETDETVVVKLKFGTMTYRKSEVASIRRAASATSAAADAARAADWRDVIVLRSGEKQVGLIVSEDGKEIVFDVVMSGKTVSKTLLARTTIPRSEVRSVTRLTDEERRVAREHLRNVKLAARRDVAAEKRLEVVTKRLTDDAVRKFGLAFKRKDYTKPVKQVELEHFVIVADVDDDFLRKVAQRLARVFEAYKAHFGVDRNESRKIPVLIFNSGAEYGAATGQPFTHPAFYRTDLKVICAGFSLVEYKAAIAAVRARLDELNRQIKEWRAKVDAERARIRAIVDGYYRQIVRAGKTTPRGRAMMDIVRREERRCQIVLMKMEKPAKEAQEKIRTVKRQMGLSFDEHAGLMIRIAYHEGFHAFLDQFLFDEKLVEHFPRWLNEGLAQYFQNARVEGGRLILGQEKREWLSLLRRWGREGKLVPLAKLVEAGNEAFHAGSPEKTEKVAIHYRLSWRLVHLLGERGRLKKEHLEAYVRALAKKTPPVEALRVLAGTGAAGLQAELDAKLGSTIRLGGGGGE